MRSILVTGGGTGIGRAIAEAFAANECRVMITGRRKEPLLEVAAALGPGRVVPFPSDITSADDRRAVVDAVAEKLGGLDVLVGCAGAVTSSPLAETDDATWRRLFETNVLGPVALARDLLPALRERRGCILNISTGASLKPVPGFGVYGATKAALDYASKVLALEAAPEVRVNVISPGGVDTPIFDTFLDAEGRAGTIAYFNEATPLGRIGQPSDIAGAARWLCSEEAAYVTGATLVVDGGLNLG